MKTTNKQSTKACGKNAKTQNCSNAKNSRGTTDCKNKAASSRKKNAADSESEADPFGTYTGNPIGFGKHEKPVQDADDL